MGGSGGIALTCAGLAPENLLYVSCKPEQTAQELPQLLEKYTLANISAVDLFPHTHHVEAVLTMVRK